jgi:hypothetical protein
MIKVYRSTKKIFTKILYALDKKITTIDEFQGIQMGWHLLFTMK